MKKKILLPTDFSKNAWNALKYASALYKNEEVDFFILNAFTVQNYSINNRMITEPGEKYYDQAKSTSTYEFQKLQKRIELLKVPNNHTYTMHSLYGLPLQAVKAFVENKDIEMVIASIKGETDALDEFIGSNTIDFMEKVRDCPVLLVPEGVPFKAPNEIVFPTGFETNFKRKELFQLCEISKITNAPISILHVRKEKNLTKDQSTKKALLEECFEALDYSFHFSDNTDVQKALHQFTESRSSEMIAFINRKHSFFSTLFSTPLVNELGNNTKVPVLALHDFQN